MLRVIYRKLRRLFYSVEVYGLNNRFSSNSKLGKGFTIQIYGDNNDVQIGNSCLLTNTSICITGNNSKVVIEDDVRFMGPCKIIMGADSYLHIKRNAGIRGVEFNLHGAKIEVGELCMFSYGITLRNHDSHKIYDTNDGSLLNPPKDIVLGKHIWIAQNAVILKGTQIGDNSVIGFGAVVTKSCESGSIMAGCPAKVVKENITWDY